MSDTSPPSSPKKPDGTTDWDVVFDDPDKGLIALIGRVTSTDALEQCGQLIIRRLFTRKNDELDVARFNRELADILSSASADGDLGVIKAEVVLMLQRIKAIRVAKARAYLENKANKQKANRRSTGSKAANTYKFINNPKLVPIAVGGSIALCALLISLIYWVAFSNPYNAPENTASESQTEEDQAAQRQREDAKLEARIQTEVARKQAALQKAVEEKRMLQRIMPPAIVLPGVFIQREIDGVLRNLKPIMPILILDKRENLSKLCLLRPKLIDIVNVSLSNRISTTATGQTIDYVKTAETIREKVNGMLHRKTITDVKLVTDGKSGDMATAGDRCTLATAEYFDYLYPPVPE